MVRFRSGENASVWISPVKCIDFKPEKDVEGHVIKGYGVYETSDPAIIDRLQEMGYQPDIMSREELDAMTAEDRSIAQKAEDLVKGATGKALDSIMSLVDRAKRIRGGKAEKPVEEPVVVEEGEEEFVCGVCGKVVGNAGALASHMKTHTEE